MDYKNITAYKIIVSVLFGLLGFVVNFYSIDFPFPPYTATVLIGLLFPMLITLTWGWRYGLLSALAGGCQSMWWIWGPSNGYAIFTIVPPFTLWILWHGYFAGMRRKSADRKWWQNMYVVEIPFRILSTINLLTLVRWAVSLNPPPWGWASEAPNVVPMEFSIFVVIKQFVVGYVILLLADVLLNIEFTRRFFGLEKRPGHTETGYIISLSLLIGVIFWVIDSVIGSVIFYPGNSFIDMLALNIPPVVIYVRTFFILACFAGGLMFSKLLRKHYEMEEARIKADENIKHLNSILKAIRNVNQLIVVETDRDKLVQQACDTMIEGRSYEAVWLGLLENGESFFTVKGSGFGEDVNTFCKYVMDGNHPPCIKEMLAGNDMFNIVDKSLKCGDCPFKDACSTREVAIVRIEHTGRLFGLLAVLLSSDVTIDEEEKGLLREVAGDIAFALHNMELEEARKQAEEELAKHRDHLEELIKERTRDLEAAQKELIKRERLSVLGQLTATVSHEIRNPLGVIRSSAFYLQRKLGHADKKITKHLNRVEKQVDLCDSIVDELLEYTRGRHSEATQGEINPWLEKVLDEITIPENVALVTECSPDLPMVHFDRDKMHRVVFNLVNNALQAVTARHDRLNEGEGPYQPQVKVSTSVADNGIRIEVADNGIGMDDKTAGRAFEPLFTTSARGTGLGLAIVRKIVEEHGGHVSLDSTPNRGTKVTLVIPAGT